MISCCSLALAESACFRPRARTFFGRSCAWLRTTGPKARPPPRNCGADWAPWRAPPVPFCLYIFFLVRLISDRPRVLWVPAWRLASCQRTTRWRMSARGSSPKISSERSREPASAPSSVVMLSFIGPSSLAGGRLSARFRQTERTRLGGGVRQLLLDGVADEDPAALGAGNGTLDEDQAAL